MKLSCPAAALLESLGFGFFSLPLCNYFPHSLKSCWNGNSKNMYPESSPHVLALWNTTAGISCCVLQEAAALCGKPGTVEGSGIANSDGKAALVGRLCSRASPHRQGIDVKPGTRTSRCRRKRQPSVGAAEVRQGGWGNSALLRPWWPGGLGKPRSDSLLAVFESVTRVQVCKAVATGLTRDFGLSLSHSLPITWGQGAAWQEAY